MKMGDSTKKIEDAAIIEEKVGNVMGENVTKKYSKGKFLGKGGFAKCYEFTSTENGKVMAAKIIPKATLKKTRHRQKLLSEIKIHRSLNHPNIVKFEHVFEDNENVYILLEMCSNQTLNDLCKRRKRLSEFEARYYVYQTVNALKYLHKNKVIHRDLKLGNLFLNDKLEIKLGDFGLAAKLEYENEKRHTVCGTPNYLAPEVLNNKSGHSFEVDVWSLGVVLYALVVGKPPFETTEVKMTYDKIKRASYTFPDHFELTENVKNLISKIFNLEPTKRPSLDQVLEHAFINNGQEIPKTMHISTLAMMPSKELIEQMLSKDNVVFSRADPKSSAIQPNKTAPATSTNSDAQKDNEVYVKKWVDYSTKYGLGYQLSNNCTGVFFNDCTKIIHNINKDYFEYYERRPGETNETEMCYYMKSYPKELHKKVTLLLHFRSYLENFKPPACNYVENATQVPPSEREPKGVYLKKWMKTKHASLLRLSNKIVQVVFQDNTEIILSSESKKVTYVNKKGERIKSDLSLALESDNSDMNKRLKYTKEILTYMLNNRQQSNS